MRTLCLAFVTAGAIFAQAPIPAAPDAAAADALRARATELLQAAAAARAKAPIQFNSLRNWTPLTPSPSAVPAAGFSGRCAVPLTGMSLPLDVDSISRTPAPTGDPLAVPPPVPSCSDVSAASADAYAAERLKKLQEAREKLKQWKEAQPAAAPADTAPAAK